ncbi:hypothetical protein BGZ74_007513 [Mortierella antarctica]|nr:hypothetical protein BGZ74_007513 [Mortierella antarctica]
MTSAKAAPYSHDEVHLIPTTSQAIIQQTWTNNREEWGKTLDLTTYHAREVVLANQEFTNNSKLQVWVLVPKTFDPENPDLGLILSAVETFLRPGMVATKELGVRDVASVSVASVFTPAHYRGYGYGSLMMRLLWSRIEQMDNVEFTFLYSDVGPIFYARMGWDPKRSEEMVIPTDFALPASGCTVTLDNVTDHSLENLVALDAQQLRETMKVQIETTADFTALAAVTPEPTCLQWLHARSRFVAAHVLKLEQHEITSLGARDQASNSFVLWFHDLVKSQLFIVRWRVDPSVNQAETVCALMGAAQAEAKKWNLSKAVIWNPEQSLGDILGLEIAYRDSAIPSLGLTVSSPTASRVEWVMNEKYSWC